MSKHGQPIKLSFRKTYMLLTFFILCMACILSMGIVLLLLNLLYTGPVTQFVVIVSGGLICALSIIIGGMIFWKSSEWISKPIVALDQAVTKVTTGDFDVTIEVDNPVLTHHEVHTEITTLVDNFNIMTKELKSMEYMSRDFMSNVSHEIKTPIATITGLTEMMLDEGLESDENNDYLRVINDSSERISDLCDNMLKVSKLDSQQILEKKDLVRLDEQIRKAAIVALESYKENGREFVFDMESVQYSCDAGLMMQVWTNLIDNAIKYSPSGSLVSITLSETHLHDERNIHVSIHNSGETISEDKMRRIFDRFYQCDQSHKDKGSGLGLSIVSRIIQLHGGRIYCNSSEYKGVTMNVELS